MARSKNTPVIEITKQRIGDLPAFIPLMHRHFQKSLPPIPPGGGRVALQAPIDLLDLITPGDLLDKIESIEIIYERP